MPNYQVRRILESREIKDEQGRIKGRQFLVLWKEENDPSWEPIENLLSSKKALKSFYNKHPQLPYPNFLAVNDDEEFNPSQAPLANKKLGVGRPQLQAKGRQVKQNMDFPQPKQRGRPPLNASEKNGRLGQVQEQQQGGIEMNAPQMKMMIPEKPQAKHKVLGLYVQSSTNEIVFYVQSQGVCSFKNRKWIIDNCIQSLAQFYQSCMVVTAPQN